MEDSSGLAAGPEVSPGTLLSGHAGELHQVWTALGGCGMQPAEELLYLYTAHLYVCLYTTWPSRHVASFLDHQPYLLLFLFPHRPGSHYTSQVPVTSLSKTGI